MWKQAEICVHFIKWQSAKFPFNGTVNRAYFLYRWRRWRVCGPPSSPSQWVSSSPLSSPTSPGLSPVRVSSTCVYCPLSCRVSSTCVSCHVSEYRQLVSIVPCQSIDNLCLLSRVWGRSTYVSSLRLVINKWSLSTSHISRSRQSYRLINLRFLFQCVSNLLTCGACHPVALVS